MEESASLNSDVGSILLKEYNELLREIHHLGDHQLIQGVNDQMKHPVDENKILTNDQAVLLQCELNAIKQQLEKNQLLQHVCREMEQRSIKSGDAICELESVIKRKENIVATMRKVIEQTHQLYDGREKILKDIKARNDQLQQQHAQLDRKQRDMKATCENSSNHPMPPTFEINTLKLALKNVFQDDIRLELKSFNSNSLIYFFMYIRLTKNDTGAASTTLDNKDGWCDTPLKCILKYNNESNCYQLKHVFFGSNQCLDPENIQSTPFPIPMLVDLVGKYLKQ